MPGPLHKYKILIADTDRRLAEVVQVLLESMGFSDITLTGSGQTALQLLKAQSFDFLITEWSLEEMGGLELIDRIRRDPGFPEPALPIILLTGRAEETDVVTARDHGINEYVLKPFNAEMLFSRLERLIEQPRNFVVAGSFTGPCRRQKGIAPEETGERRGPSLTPQKQPMRPQARGLAPQIWLASDNLRKKLGAGTSLSSIITPETLNRAQATIESISNESLLWIQENLQELTAYYRTMTQGALYTLLPADMSETALTISSRAGTFGFTGASRVAYLLHIFCQHHLRPERPTHHLVAEKHLDALKVTLSNNLAAEAPGNEDEIVRELQNLVEKYAA